MGNHEKPANIRGHTEPKFKPRSSPSRVGTDLTATFNWFVKPVNLFTRIRYQRGVGGM